MTNAEIMTLDGGSRRRSIPYVNFAAQFEEERDEIEAIVADVFGRGEFVGGPGIGALEEELASYCGTAHAVALNSGTDALILAMAALDIGPGDEVITPPNSFVASAAAVVQAGATPVFADVQADQNIDPAAIEAAITPRTKAIMPVHLTGRVAPMEAISSLARSHGLFVVEDAAQSFGSRLGERLSGSFGDVGCFSAHPLKNLNAAGDAGFLVTDRDDVAEKVRLLRNHGLKDRDSVTVWGQVARMDTLQAELLRMRLRRLPSVIERRRRNARIYRDRIRACEIFVAPCKDDEFNTFHTFVVQTDDRDGLKEYLNQTGVQTAIHYPTPIHLQPAAASLGYERGRFPEAERQAGRILSLPIHQFLCENDIGFVASMINEYFQ